ncbi:MAG: IS66 family transposase [Oscillospiraceae bacterium]|nr:IS66 family transposase [Oscillospiraceae bacterium]
MEADIEKYIKSIEGYSREQLLEECAVLKRQYTNLHVQVIEQRKAETEMSKEYQRISEKVKDQQKQIAELQQKLDCMCAQNDLLLRHRFGSHNEKISALSSEESDLQDPLSEDAVPEDNVVSFEEASRRRQETKNVKNAFGSSRCKETPTHRDFSNLPHRNTFSFDINELNRRFGEGNWQIIGWHKKELLHRITVSYYVEVRHSPVIKDMRTGTLAAMPMPDVFFSRSSATSSVVAGIMYDLTVKALPYYRQEMDMANHGLTLPRQDMANWVIRFAESHLRPVFEYLHYLLCQNSYSQCDESWLQVLHEDGRKATTKSYVWAHTTGELDTVPPIVVFSYEKTRGTDHLRRFYANFEGVLTSDSYISYSVFADESNGAVVSTACFMHARRRFFEALMVIKTSKLTDEQYEALPEVIAIRKIASLYAVEGKFRDMSPEERLTGRQQEEKSLVDDFYTFLRTQDLTSPLLSEKMRDAIQYSLNHEKELCRFLEDGRIPIDNGYCENAIRLYAQGRRNWLFCNTPSGADAKMIIYSLVETARRNKANPLLYLTYLLENVPEYLDLPVHNPRMDELLPWSQKYKDYEADQVNSIIDAVIPQSQDKPYYKPNLTPVPLPVESVS